MDLSEIDAEIRIRVQAVYLGKTVTSREMEVFERKEGGSMGECGQLGFNPIREPWEMV